MELKLDKICGRKFTYKWDETLHSTNVEIQLPNLQKLKNSVWGDWGPMYTFELIDEEPITISYNGKDRKLDQKLLLIESPMIADEREKYPYYILVEDGEFGFNHYLYLDRKFELTKVVIKRLPDHVTLFETFPRFSRLLTSI